MSDFEELGSELVIQHTGQVFPLTQETVTIGGGEDNVIVLADPKVSSQHAAISWQAETGAYVIEDLGSAEGTYVNERPVEGPQPLRHGDVIRVGDTVFDLKLKPALFAAGIPPTPPSVPAEAREPRRGPRNPVLAGIVIVLLVGVTIACAALFAVLLFGGGADTPDVTIQTPADGALIAVNGEIILQATATGADDITLLELNVDGALVASASSPDPAGSSSLTASKMWTFGVPGEHEVSAVAYTASGRTSRTESVEVTVTTSGSSVPPGGGATSTPTPATEATATATPAPELTPTPTATPRPGAPQIEFFRANPQSINAGECTTLEWGEVSDADEARIDPDIGGVGTPGDATVCPAETTTYVLTARGPGGTTTASTTISVIEALADLTIDSIGFAPSVPVQGEDTEVRITIRNIGEGNAGPFNWEWQPGSEPSLGGRVDGGLNANDQIVVTANWRPQDAYASLSTVARVDTDNEVAETDKGNNQLVAVIQVNPAGGTGTISPTSDAELDGFRANRGTGSNRQDVLVGNGEITDQGELVWRGFMSFSLSDIPAGATIDRVELRFFQVNVGGDPYGKLGNLILDHIVYGDRLTDTAYSAPALESAVLPQQTAPQTWYVISDPMLVSWLENDLTAGRTMLQVRLRFMQETDADGFEDYVGIESGNDFFGTGNVAQLIVTYSR
jgi:hypothetical protein